MLLSTRLLAAAVFAVGIAADSTTTTASPTSSSKPSGTSTASAVTHTVEVGQNGFKFQPAVVNASVGDYVAWNFYPGGHTVVQCAYEWPCIPYDLTGPNRTGFYSGQLSPSVIESPPPQYVVRINDTEPIFYYCSAPGSCIDQHMIGVINPNSTETFDIQLAYTENATFQLNPGDAWPSETADPFTVTATPTGEYGSPATSSSTPPASSSSSSSSSLGAGAIAGIAIGGAAVVILAAALIYLCGRRGGLDVAYRRSTHTLQPPPVVEARYGPKSPGQDTFVTSSSRYQGSPGPDSSFNGSSNRSPPMSQYISSPPPMSPGSHPAYGMFPGATNQVHSPLMGSSDDGRGYYDQGPQETPPPPTHISEAAEPEPVELPASSDPGNSPLPGYQPMRQLSWAQGPSLLIGRASSAEQPEWLDHQLVPFRSGLV